MTTGAGHDIKPGHQVGVKAMSDNMVHQVNVPFMYQSWSIGGLNV
jgi:hypothetical protein